MKIRVKNTTLQHDGQRYGAGQEIELTAEQAQPLLDLGVAVEVVEVKAEAPHAQPGQPAQQTKVEAPKK